jgi:hypothetical protein
MGGSMSTTSPGFQYASIFAMYLPVTYVMVGFLVDIVSQQFKQSTASLAAITGVLLNFGLNSIVGKLGLTTQKIQEAISYNGDISTLYTRVYRGCTVPGFENLESILAPQSFVVIFSLYFFFLIDILLNNPGQSVAGLSGLAAVALLVQGLLIAQNGCWKAEYYWKSFYMTVPVLLSAVFGVLAAVIVGFSTQAIRKTLPGSSTDKNINPTGSSSGGFGSSGPVTGPTGDSALPPVGGSTGGSSGSGSDDNQFVCEAYKNGELITSTIAE